MSDPSTMSAKRPVSRVPRAQLIGAVVGYLLLAGTLALIFGPRTEIAWWMPTVLIGPFVGGSVGAAVQLLREGRSTEVGKVLGQQVMGLLLATPVFVAAVVGQRVYGDLGWWAGLLGSSALLFVGAVLFRRRGCNADPGDARERR